MNSKKPVKAGFFIAVRLMIRDRKAGRGVGKVVR